LGDHEVHAAELERDRSVLVSDPALEHLALEADRRRLLARIEADEDRFCVAAGVPMRTLQEWLGHRDIKTTMIYADYQASEHEHELVERAFAGTNSGTNLSESEHNSQQLSVPEDA
jgi:integrase